MQLKRLCWSLCAALCCISVAATQSSGRLVSRRDNSDTGLPTLGSGSTASPSLTTSTDRPDSTSSNAGRASTVSTPVTSSLSPSPSPTTISDSLSDNTGVATTVTSSPFPTVTGSVTEGNATAGSTEQVLPLQPRITPAFAIGGVILIVSGLVYALIGVKNQWIHVFLSAAYLASLSIAVLLVYVMNSPIRDAIQGAYFVGIFMTGLIFGGGALIFKEITEGLGCLLGGYCLAMWFLTLKEGALITTQSGRGIFIAAFSTAAWSLSFSHYTRPYGLIGATSFSGSTAFILGIDCFSRAGLKEFWVYVWNLNEDLFPLNTNTYPITKGIRVESSTIVLGCIISVISQVKLWKVVKNRQNQRKVAKVEDDRRREVVEEAIGRHLERQNNRDRSEWEKRYGDGLQSKRNTMLWSEAHGEKRYSQLSEVEVDQSQHSASSDSLEMNHIAPRPSRSSMYGSKGKRQSTVNVQAIPEVEEENVKEDRPDFAHHDDMSHEGAKARPRPESVSDGLSRDPQSPQLSLQPSKMTSSESLKQAFGPPSLKPQSSKPNSEDTTARLQSLEPEEWRSKKRDSLQSLQRRSLQSLTSRSPGQAVGKSSVPPSLSRAVQDPGDSSFSQSREALVPPNNEPLWSRRSSLAATLDEDNETMELPDVEVHESQVHPPPQIIASPAQLRGDESQLRSSPKYTDQPPTLPEDLDADLEELVRPLQAKNDPSGSILQSKHVLSSTGPTDALWEDEPKSSGEVCHTTSKEGLTQGALQQVPSQLSDIVLSYRTNEWAKHISTAEIPMYEEPEHTGEGEAELSTHLAEPTSRFQDQEMIPRIEQTVKRPSELSSPVVAASASTTGIAVNRGIQPQQQTRPKPSPLIRRSVTDPSQVSAGKNNRSPSTMQVRQSLTGVLPIDENAVTEFTAPTQTQVVGRSVSMQVPQTRVRDSQQFVAPAATVTRPSTSTGTYNQAATLPQRTPSRSSLVYGGSGVIDPTLMRPNSGSTYLPQRPNHSSHQGYLAASSQANPFSSSQPQISPVQTINALRSDTRLADYNASASHQPQSRRNETATDSRKREAQFADWRLKQHQSSMQDVVPKHVVDHRRSQMLMDREDERLRREQEKHAKVTRDAVFDQSMRTAPMLDAHRVMMRKMQDQANKQLTPK